MSRDWFQKKRNKKWKAFKTAVGNNSDRFKNWVSEQLKKNADESNKMPGVPESKPGDNVRDDPDNTAVGPNVVNSENTSGVPESKPGDNVRDDPDNTADGPNVVIPDNTSGVSESKSVELESVRSNEEYFANIDNMKMGLEDKISSLRTEMFKLMDESYRKDYILNEMEAYRYLQQKMNDTILNIDNKKQIIAQFIDIINDDNNDSNIKKIIAEIWYIALIRLPLNATITDAQLLYADHSPKFADILSGFTLGILDLKAVVEEYVKTLKIKNDKNTSEAITSHPPTETFAVEYFLSLAQFKLIDYLTPIYGSARSQIRGYIGRHKLSTIKKGGATTSIPSAPTIDPLGYQENQGNV